MFLLFLLLPYVLGFQPVLHRPVSSATKYFASRSDKEKAKTREVKSQPLISADHPLSTPVEINSWKLLMQDSHAKSFSTKQTNDIFLTKQSLLLSLQEDLTKDHLQSIDDYWNGDLLPLLGYMDSSLLPLIKLSLKVAYHSHLNQTRKSGEPFIVHPIGVTKLLAKMEMDSETIIAGLLHDTVEDTSLTFSQIQALFGLTVSKIVEGETKVSKLPKLAFSDYADEQAENLRQMFVAMADDHRIIIVKLADRLHNMRTLTHMSPSKQQKISRETLDIFAPLAHRMGIWAMKSELEDISFEYLYPAEYKRLKRKLLLSKDKFQNALEKSQRLLENALKNDPLLMEQGVVVEVEGRMKELHSLWLKMNVKQQPLNRITDVVALRVIITPQTNVGGPSETDSSISAVESREELNQRGVWLCYHVLGIVQHLRDTKPIPTSVKDYISFPKPNGYQSLHTAIISDSTPVEIQIRTLDMHRVAETGMAAHWHYSSVKRQVGGFASQSGFDTPWLKNIKEWENESVSSREFVESVRRELLGKRVFVFLRNGKILNLSRGATAIDAAFSIHTEVGLTMHGVEINGKSKPLSYELQNGDVVNILSGEGKPALDWLRWSTARSTRAKLRIYFRKQHAEALTEAGKIMINDFLSIHRDLILENTYLKNKGLIPIDAEDGLQKFLPGPTQHLTVDSLCLEVGRDRDRQFLRRIISKLFLVPLSILTAADSHDLPAVPTVVSKQEKSWLKKFMSTKDSDGAPKNLIMDDDELFRIGYNSEEIIREDAESIEMIEGNGKAASYFKTTAMRIKKVKEAKHRKLKSSEQVSVLCCVCSFFNRRSSRERATT